MGEGEVRTRSNRGQWENSVEGAPELSRSYSSREEAVEQGAALAAQLGREHVVEDAPPTGAVTDPDPDTPAS